MGMLPLLIVVALMAYAAKSFAPDFVRYMRIKAM
jgi:hypothetical protein